MTPGNPFDPFSAEKTRPEDRWSEIFSKPNRGGALRKRQENPESATDAADVDQAPVQENPEAEAGPPRKVTARLSNPLWMGEHGYFNEKMTATVDGELDPGISHLTKVTFTLFAQLPGGALERMEVKESHLKNGCAKAEFTLWIPSYRDEAGFTLQNGEYCFSAKHREGAELKSGSLPVSKRKSTLPSARELQRGVRGEDVLGWQRFLMRIRKKPRFSSLHEIDEDGIFGGETRKATVGFQCLVELEADGIVGPKTREQAQGLGAEFEADASAGRTEGATKIVRNGKVPLFPASTPVPIVPAAPPPGQKGSDREESWKRLRAEAWRKTEAIKASLQAGNAVVQSVEDGSGDFLYDEYKVKLERLPEGVEPEALLLELASNLNGTVINQEFDFINTFRRRRKGNPTAGEIVDIDIMGPDDGSVILGELGKTYFIYQTIDCAETWSHPENGSREFGYQVEGDTIIFYTRGVSRPGNFVIGMLGAEPQRRGWTALMKGFSSQINVRGGKSEFTTFGMTKERRFH